MSDILSKIFKVVEILCLVALIAWVANNFVKGCNANDTIKAPITAATARLDSIATQIDSLRDVNFALSKENQNLTQWIILYKNQKPQIVTETQKVILFDTTINKIFLNDTLRKTEVITEFNLLKLPYPFALKDKWVSIAGIIDTAHIHIDTLGITNQIVLRDNMKKTLWTESHSVIIQNSNPYISSIIPAYTYTRPTKNGEILKKIGWFTAGLGIGYSIRTIQKR